MTKLKSTLMLTLLCAAVAQPAAALRSKVEADLPSAADYGQSILPELSGVVSWRTFARVEPIKQGDKIVMQFGNEVRALDQTQVRVQGFMMPLDARQRQTHFLISAVPASCPYCMPAGPEAIVEVMSKTPVKFGFDPIVLSGKLALVKDNRSGLLYRMTDAQLVDVEPVQILRHRGTMLP